MYFDNFRVTHNRGRIIEENHYYAYGLRIAAISSKKVGDAAEGSLDNKNLYNDKEFIDDADLGWYDYGFRSYDPQIGRFPQLDPLTFDYPFYTPYQYAGGDPVSNVDVDGLEPATSVFGTAANPLRMQEVLVTSSRAAAATRALGSAASLLGTGTTIGGTLTSEANQKIGNELINQALKQSWWEKTVEFVGRNAALLGRFGGTVVGVLMPLDAGSRYPHGDENYYRYTPSQFAQKYPNDPTPAFFMYKDPKPKLAPEPPKNPGPPAPPDDDDDGAGVRFQVQQGLHQQIADDVKVNSARKGVTKVQGYEALAAVYNMAVRKDPSLRRNKAFASAIVEASAKIKSIGPGGISRGLNYTTLQELFQHKGLEYRLDIEVLRGSNFRVKK